jgi:hypothetical protein
MAVKRGRPVARKVARKSVPAPTKRKPAPAAPAKQTRTAKTAKAAPAKSTRGRKATDVTEYATKEPTDYHKAFARWIVNEVGFDPKTASPMKAFLMGVSIATAARPKFMDSDFLAEWRESSGQAKRGPKTSEDKTVGKAKPKSSKVVEEDEDEFEDDDEDFEDESEEDDDDFEDDEDESDEDEDEDEDSDEDDDDDFEDEDDEDESDEDDDEDLEDEEEELPPAKKRPVKNAAKSGSRGATRTGTRSAATKGRPAKGSTKGKAKSSSDDADEMLF